MIFKQKSLIVAFASSAVISLVLISTLAGYLMYIELKGEERKRSYLEDMQKVNAMLYSKYVEPVKLAALMESSGVLRGKPVIEGEIKNAGYRDISCMFIKIKFLDKDDAIIYEASFHPQEPSLGASGLPQVSIPYLSSQVKAILKKNEALSFKKILSDCPREIVAALKEKDASGKGAGRWSGKLAFELLSVEFPVSSQ